MEIIEEHGKFQQKIIKSIRKETPKCCDKTYTRMTFAIN